MNAADYENARRSFRLVVPDDFNYARDVIDAWAKSHPTKVALIAVDRNGENRREFTFLAVSRSGNRFANALAALGASPGDRAFVMLPRVPEWHLASIGMFKAGVVPMPATPLCTPKDIAYRINRSGASIAVTDLDGAAKVDAVRSQCPSLVHRIVVGGECEGWSSFDSLVSRGSDSSPPARPTSKSDPLVIYFTSGTTSFPKMVLHTQASYGAGHEITARFWQDLKPTDVQWGLSDTGWAASAWTSLYGQWRAGAAVFTWDGRGKPDPDLILRILASSEVTSLFAPPTLYRAFVQLPLGRYGLDGVRQFLSAGEPLNPETFRVWQEATGKSIREGYGQTETVCVLANSPALEIRPGSTGKPTPGFDVAIVDPQGRRLLPGEEGHIAIRIEPERPVGLMKEYWRDEEATAAAMHDGWYFTGDRAACDPDGYFWFASRSDDVITSSAYRIGPFEVESALMEHAAVAETAVIGKPDPTRTEIVKAFVVLAAGHTASESLVQELQEHVKRVTAPYKYPREIEFTAELPKTISGKIRRTELRALERERLSQRPATLEPDTD